MPAARRPALPRPPLRPVHRLPVEVRPLAPHLYTPTDARPLRAKRHVLAADTQVPAHSHAWAQLAWSATGVMRLTAERGTYLVPPSRAVWIPPRVEHAVTVVETAELRTLYLHADSPLVPARRGGVWLHCRVLEVSALLRALLLALPTAADDEPIDADTLAREALIAPLLADELQRATPLPLGVPLPADKRLLALCQAVLDDPTRHDTLAEWVRDIGASERTVARLFRDELGTSFGQWRQQVLLARALTMAARKRPIGEIAAELGYASASAFSAMVRRSLGAPPSHLFGPEGPTTP